jgi:hypothetical protein
VSARLDLRVVAGNHEVAGVAFPEYDVDILLGQGALDLEQGAVDDLAQVDRKVLGLHVAHQHLHFFDDAQDVFGFNGHQAQLLAGREALFE